MNKSQIKKMLVVAPNWIGDTVLALPAISGIREFFSHSKITLIALSHIGELFRESPYVDEIKVLTNPNSSGVNKGGFMTDALLLRQDNFDLAILFPNSFRSALLVRLANIPLRCGYKKDGRGFLLNMPIKLNDQLKKVHQTEYYLNILHMIQDVFAKNEPSMSKKVTDENKNPDVGTDIVHVGTDLKVCPYSMEEGFSGENKPIKNPQFARLFISKDESSHALQTLRNNNMSPDDLIVGINPGAAYGSSKRWYPDRFGQVAKTLTRGYNAKIIIFGSQSEITIAEEISQNAKVAFLNLIGKTSIRELMALISYCKVFITNDSGPMHIAAALGVPIVAIFGSTDPLITGPKSAENIVIKKVVSCSPCFLRKCPTNLECMDLIGVEDVLRDTSHILKNMGSVPIKGIFK